MGTLSLKICEVLQIQNIKKLLVMVQYTITQDYQLERI